MSLTLILGNWMPVIEFLKANASIERSLAYPAAPPLRKAEESREPFTSSKWKPSDFLPARPPFPLLPRGLFKD